MLTPVIAARAVARRISPDVALAALGLVAGLAAGVGGAGDPRVGLVLTAGVVLVMLIACRPVLVGLVALVGVYATQRVGATSTVGGSGGISYSDALLVVAAFLAIPAVVGRPELRRLSVAAYGLATYLVCLLPTVFLNASTRGYLEWTHRLVLVGGALVIGAWFVREQVVRTALRWLTAATAVVALLALVNAASSGFQPAAPIGLNKNFVGAQLGIVLIVLVVAYRHLQLPVRVRLAAIVLVAGGLAASQSRGGMLAAAAGLLVTFALDPRAHSRAAKAAATVIAIGFALVVYVSVHAELNQGVSEVNNSSLGVRFNVERVTREIWRSSPVDGVGLKYFNAGGYGEYVAAANNVVDNELAESGLIGLAGFIVLQGAMVLAGLRRRRGDQLMIAAIGCVIGSLLHGMVDIYWTAGVVPLPFILLGMALAREPTTEREPGPDDELRPASSASALEPVPVATSHRQAGSPR